MDTQLLSRIQFAVTAGFHFLFPPLTIGLACLLVIIEAAAWRTGKAVFDQAGQFFGKILGLTFAVGVATGIVMEFQFGTNWDRFSTFVGDIFGPPLVAEAVLAFFLESAFLGLYLFGRQRISKRIRVFAIAMVALGASLSAFWIIVANSWMQTPAGYTITDAIPNVPSRAQLVEVHTETPAGYTVTAAAAPNSPSRAQLSDFRAAVFNPSTMVRFHHTLAAAVVCGAFFMAGCAAWILRRDAANTVARLALRVSVPVGLLFSVLVVFPFGHQHTQQVARTQPEKFAAIEGLYNSQQQAPLVMFAHPQTPPPRLHAKFEVPGFLSWLAFGDIDARIQGIDEFPPDEIPPLWLTFVSFHSMVVLGLLSIAAMACAAFLQLRGRLFTSRRFLLFLIILVPLPLAACQFGWMAAEVGRQPWVVYKVMRTSAAFSASLPPSHVLSSLIVFSAIYLILLVLYLYLLIGKLQHAPTASQNAEVRV